MALKLGKTVGEIEAMPASELREWMGLFRLHTAEAERANRKGVRRGRR